MARFGLLQFSTLFCSSIKPKWSLTYQLTHTLLQFSTTLQAGQPENFASRQSAWLATWGRLPPDSQHSYHYAVENRLAKQCWQGAMCTRQAG